VTRKALFLKINIAPGDVPPFRVAKAGHEIKLKPHYLVRRAGLEQGFEFGVLVNGTHGCDKARPVCCLQKLRLAVLLHHLREDDELVVNRFALLAASEAVGREVEQILVLDIFYMCLFAERAEGSQHGTVGPEGA